MRRIGEPQPVPPVMPVRRTRRPAPADKDPKDEQRPLPGGYSRGEESQTPKEPDRPTTGGHIDEFA